MRIAVNLDVCEAHGDCVIQAPEVFDLGDEDDAVRLLDPEPPEEFHEAVERAARACPVDAIAITE